MYFDKICKIRTFYNKIFKCFSRTIMNQYRITNKAHVMSSVIEKGTTYIKSRS
jgi:hypothetical protein